MIGSYQAVRDVKTGTSNSSFTLPKGAFISVTQVDKARNKILVEMGPGAIDWKHESFLNLHDFEYRD